MGTLITKRFKYILLGIASVLCIPFYAMQFTNEVQWDSTDFIVAFILLLGLGITIEFILQKAKTIEVKRTLILLVICAFLLIWAELAVGIFNTSISGN